MTFPFPRPAGKRSSALVVVLCFVVLMAALVLLMMTRSMTSGMISQASANVSKTDLYGHGAVDQVIGDLEQEIVAGSKATAIRSSGTNIYIYRPTVPINAVPALQGANTSSWNTTLPNLVKESTHGVPSYPATGYDANAPTRAANINSATDASVNGRSISAARWNKHLLLPRDPGRSSLTSTTPVTSFNVPDWILTAADGTNPTTFNNTTMSDPKLASYVVGRYAYAIYNEGGLLDANVAGSPGNLSASAGAGGGPSQKTIWSRKGPEAFADLTVLPGIKNLSMGAQKMVDQLVGWRNYATVHPSGSFPNYTFGPSGSGNSSINNYFNYLLSLSTSFMTTGNTALYQNQSDHLFTTRQQLISFMHDVANGNSGDEILLQDAMMYLGTFTRTLNQPSYWPDPTRPVETGGAWSGTIWTANANGIPPLSPPGYTGYNNAVNQESNYNPPFRSVRAKAAFTRNDKTKAVIGEPLVKKRFALNRVLWLSPYGPIAEKAPPGYLSYLETTYGLSHAFLEEGTSANIKSYFGLTWADNNRLGYAGYWTYSELNIPGGYIGLLSDAQAANREPDFFELLQAAVKVGAISNPSVIANPGGRANATGAYAQIRDTQLIYQILQMGANIIDEANPTQYPTHIQFTAPDPGGGNQLMDIYGVTDLPYLYAYKQIAFPYGVPATTTPPLGARQNSTIAPNPAGQDVAMVIPVIWNPCDVNGPSPAPSVATGVPALTRLSITAAYGRPNLPTPTVGFTLDPVQSVEGTPYPNYPTYFQWTEPNTELRFNNPDPALGSVLYREPTALIVQAEPVGSDLNTGPANTVYSDPASGNNIVGFPIATFPERWNDGTYTYTANQLHAGGYVFQPTSGLTIRLKYQGPGGWVTYYQNYLNGEQNLTAAYPDSTNPGRTIFNPPGTSFWDTGGEPTANPPALEFVRWSALFTYDPRTVRWGTSIGVYSDPFEQLPVLSFLDTTLGPLHPYAFAVQSIRPSATPGNDVSANLPQKNYAPQNSGWTYATTGFGTGAPSQQGPVLRQGAVEQNLRTSNQMYYADADRVVRRAMGAYVPLSNTSSAPSSTGLPLASAAASVMLSTGGSANNVVLTAGYRPSTTQSQCRPIILHRPFRSVAELGYVFSDTPWRNIDFFTPESGFSAFLDVFCINEDYRSDAVSAGVVDLNTKQAPVLQALLAGACQDEDPATSLASLTPNVQAAQIAQLLVNRTTVGGNPGAVATGRQPLTNIADLVGRWWKAPVGIPIDGSIAYDGFSADLGAASANPLIERFRETTMRALSDAGQVGTWNLMIDLVAQSGRYPASAKDLPDFLVEGERHYWVHLAIDRQTGQVIDENIEVVNE